MTQADKKFNARIHLRHYIAKKDKWVDRGEATLPAAAIARFVEMVKRTQPEILDRIKWQR